MNGFEKRTNEKKKLIEEVTIGFLIEELNNIKIADIAKKANVSQVSLYNYYGNKIGLVIAALKRLVDIQLVEVEQLIHSNQPFNQKLKEIVLWKKEGVKRLNPCTFKQVYEQDTEFQQYIDNYGTKAGYPLFMDLMKQGREEGYIRPTIKDETLMLYVKVMEGVLMATDEDLMNVASVTEEFMDMFFYGILRQKE
jgi:AcrR family transcriptional regulator